MLLASQHDQHCGASIDAFDNLGFYVLAPYSQIKAGTFGDLITEDSIKRKVKARISVYEGTFDAWFEKTVLPMLARLKLGILAWESVLDALPITVETRQMREFYETCLKFNLVRVQKYRLNSSLSGYSLE